ncbi:MAG TPA: 2-iminoacetate synthase ThiH [Desulfobaccales bacterium]
MKTGQKNSPFAEILAAWPEERLREIINRAGPEDVRRALGREQLFPEDLAALLSPQAASRLEEMARLAQALTRRHFGRTMGLYVPLYLSNVCTADCTYCGYAARSGSRGARRTLTQAEIRAECEFLASHGFQSVLLLCGDAPKTASVNYLAEAVALARRYFVSVSVEVYALDRKDYGHLVALGLEGVTLYMETYHRDTYSQVHLRGKKRDFDYRLGAIERAGRAGVRRLSIGALLGLADWRLDGFWTALHARYLQKECWQSAIAVSFPRLRTVPPRFAIRHPLSDRELVQLMLALRLFLPEVGFNLSTRERASLRDRLIPLGVTMMSAGSSTRPGGYAHYGEETLAQFEIEDRRSPAEVAQAIRRAGYDPVWKDFDRAFDEIPT